MAWHQFFREHIYYLTSDQNLTSIHACTQYTCARRRHVTMIPLTIFILDFSNKIKKYHRYIFKFINLIYFKFYTI